MTDPMVTFRTYAAQDVWFAQHHLGHVTEPFLHWWLDYYEDPTAYLSGREVLDGEALHQYFIRCAFALAGWQAGASQG